MAGQLLSISRSYVAATKAADTMELGSALFSCALPETTFVNDARNCGAFCPRISALVSYNPITGEIVFVTDFSKCTQRDEGQTDKVVGYYAWFRLLSMKASTSSGSTYPPSSAASVPVSAMPSALSGCSSFCCPIPERFEQREEKQQVDY